MKLSAAMNNPETLKGWFGINKASIILRFHKKKTLSTKIFLKTPGQTDS